MRSLLVPALAAVLATTSAAQSASPCAREAAAPSSVSPEALSPAVAARVDSAVRALMTRERIPGVSVAILVGDSVRWERGYGFADLENCVAASPATVYRLASVSKPITATAVMQLAEQGRFDLDAPIQRYVPSFPAKRYPVTARQLLGHLSGIRHYQGDEELSIRDYPSLTAALAIFQADSLLHAPGGNLTYTTYGYTLLGAALEEAARTSFLEYVRAHIATPLGMASLRDDSVGAIIRHRARGYTRDSVGVIHNAAFLNSSYKLPGGGLISNAGDLARFGAALQDGRLVRPATFTQMSTHVKLTDGREQPYGYGLILGSAGVPSIPADAVWHGGVQQGVTTMLYLLPRDRISVVMLANLEGVALGLATTTSTVASMMADDVHRTRLAH